MTKRRPGSGSARKSAPAVRPPSEPPACPIGDPTVGPEPICPVCGFRGPLTWIHGEGRCARCGAVLDTCCSGAPLDGE